MHDFNLDAAAHHLWQPIQPSLKALKKSEWGFRHPQLAKLCTPFGKDPDDGRSVHPLRSLAYSLISLVMQCSAVIQDPGWCTRSRGMAAGLIRRNRDWECGR